jgi:hypothetical protein
VKQSFQLQKTQSSPYAWFFLPPVMLFKRTVNLIRQPQKETGAAGEQPVSDRADG